MLHPLNRKVVFLVLVVVMVFGSLATTVAASPVNVVRAEQQAAPLALVTRTARIDGSCIRGPWVKLDATGKVSIRFYHPNGTYEPTNFDFGTGKSKTKTVWLPFVGGTYTYAWVSGNGVNPFYTVIAGCYPFPIP